MRSQTTLCSTSMRSRQVFSEDVANAVRFLASPSAAYITGQVIHVNGGMYM